MAHAKTSTMPAMGIRGSRGTSGPGGWPVLAESPRENISRLQRRPDAREALDRPSAICLAERMDAVPRLLEEGRQRPRRVPGHAEPLDRERVEFPRGQGALGGNPASPEQEAEPTETRENRGPHIPTEFELLNRILDGVRRGVARDRLVDGVLVEFAWAHPTTEQGDEEDNRRQHGDREEHADGGARRRGPSRCVLGPRIRWRSRQLGRLQGVDEPRPEQQEEDREAEGEEGGQDLPPRERFRRTPRPLGSVEQPVDDPRHEEPSESDEEQVPEERVDRPDRGRLRSPGGRPGKRLPARVEVGEVEREPGDEEDREEQKDGDRPRGPPPPETGHLHAKAVTVHNGFPEACNAGSGSGDAELREEPLPTTLAEELKAEGRDEGCRAQDERDEPAGPRLQESVSLGRGGRRVQEGSAGCERARREQHVEHADPRKDDRRSECEGDCDPLRMQDLAAFVGQGVVDPLAALVDALHEPRGLQLLEMLEERRLAEVQQAAQVRDRLAPHVESFEDPHADVGGERLEALLVQRDLAAAGVHGRNPMSEWGLERFPSVRPRPNRAGGNGDV